jgi:hypothetical protein
VAAPLAGLGQQVREDGMQQVQRAAQNTTRSTGPWAQMAAATRRTACTSVTSSGQARLPGWVCTKSPSAAASRADTSTCAPWACKAAAVARPMPLEAPTNHTRWPCQRGTGGFRAMVALLSKGIDLLRFS